jgi:tRNA A-37 threonylcarbamoyl transferase component Bud32/energy-coupling factor transporter ATP-binding protein EcfA2
VRANLPNSAFFLGKIIPGRPDVIIEHYVTSGNDGHLYRGRSTQLARDVACKVIPRANLRHNESGKQLWQQEVHKANSLLNSAVVRFESVCEWMDAEADIDCVVLISEFVNGPDLRKFTKTASGEITVAFVVQWLSTMLNLLNEMKLRGIQHGDLHAGNIIVEDRSSYDLQNPRFVFRVTDFGVAEASSDPRFRDDYLQIAATLAELLGRVNYAELNARDKFIFDFLRQHFLARHLIEQDPTRDPLARTPDALYKLLENLDKDYQRVAAHAEATLVSPFDYLSCEQIGEAPALLRALYSDRFLGLTEIESRNNVVVTGPRGCGKTTVFRSLGLDQRTRVNEADPISVHYLGVYYRCDDLYFNFPRYKLPQAAAAIDIPIHFIVATLLARLLESLEVWAKQYFEEEFRRSESAVVAALWNVIGFTPPQVPGWNTFRVLISRLDKERARAAEWNRFVNDPKRTVSHCFGPDVLLKACEVLAQSLLFVRERPIYFFIDDYSAPKISKELQQNINRLFMQRSSLFFFKISTESPVSFAKSDIDGKVYVENREFMLHNLGLVFLHAAVEAKLRFIEDVFRRRLASAAPDFPAKELEDLTGREETLNNNEFARGIREGRKPLLSGKEVICSLCSGDIHYVISLVGDMVRLAGGRDALAAIDKIPRIDQGLQNKAIRDAAGGFLKNLRGVPKYGEKLVAIVEAFGNVANSHLRFLNSKNQDQSPPKQASRIEPFESLNLSFEAQALYEELLRYSVFIEDYRGKSRRGNVVPRLYVRRFLIPHFNLTFSTRDSIGLEPDEFEQFIVAPRDFEKSHIITDERSAKAMVERQLHLTLNWDNS